MKGEKLKTLFLTLAIGLAFSAYPQTPLTDWVNPLIGTKNIWFLHGRTTPFVTPPFGMTHWTPQTRISRINELNYYYRDNYIIGFRGSHKPAKWMSDYGHVSIMPGIGEVKTLSDERKLKFSHKDEVSTPYYYSVDLKAKGSKTIKAEMTATERCGIFRFTFPENTDPYILLEGLANSRYFANYNKPISHMEINWAREEIAGYNSDRGTEGIGPVLPNFKGYFVIKIDQPIKTNGTWFDQYQSPNTPVVEGQSIGAWVNLKPGTQMAIVRIGTSFISIDQARENLEKEIPDFDFDKVKEQTKQVWENYLNRIQVEGGRDNEMGIFYSSMYHSLLFPRRFSEYGRYYSAFDDTIHQGDSYNDFSLWDTFRGEHPLLTIIAPDRVDGMVQALLNMYQEGGYMPKWPNPSYTNIMIGTHADAVVADAIVKGFHGFDLDTVYAAVWKDAMVPQQMDSIYNWGDRQPVGYYEARGGLSWYKKLGYVPADKTAESVSRTLEFAYDDFCVAQVAQAVGKMDDYDFFMRRSKNYRNLYNPQTGFMAPKNADGTWHENPKAGFTEGSPWTYLFCVMQDVPGMIELMGGKEQFTKKLDKSFRGLIRYIHENEPGHHYTYLYDYAGEPWKTQKLVAKNRRTKYHNKPFGLNGDDDCGQMSAWYILSALGFYSVTPGSDVYAIGTPLFPKVTVYPNPNDKSIKFTILANHVSKRNKYIQSVYLNGVKLEEPFLRHSTITKGGKLVFEMGKKPNKQAFGQ